MSLARPAGLSIALLALVVCGPVFAAVVEPSAQTLCNAIGSEISVPRDAEPASATKARSPGSSGVNPVARKQMSVNPALSTGGGGDASVSPRGRWKAFLPGTFK